MHTSSFGPEYGVRWLDIFTHHRNEASLQGELPGGNDLYPNRIIHRDPTNYFGVPIVRQYSSMIIEMPIYLRSTKKGTKRGGTLGIQIEHLDTGPFLWLSECLP